jgi:hypothetical protein
MKIVFATTTLIDQELPAGSGQLRLECSAAAQIRELFRATNSAADARGNRRRMLPFTVAYVFTSQRLAEEFWLDHYDDLPDSGTLTFTCGYTGDTSTRTVSAILERCVPRPVTPLIVEVDYSFILAAAPA